METKTERLVPHQHQGDFASNANMDSMEVDGSGPSKTSYAPFVSDEMRHWLRSLDALDRKKRLALKQKEAEKLALMEKEAEMLARMETARLARLDTAREMETGGPAGGAFGVTSFSNFFPKERASKMLQAWPMLESSLQDFGISSSLNIANNSITVSTTARTKDAYAIDKAQRLLELLSATDVPPSMALETFTGSRQYSLIKTGDICSSYGLQKEEYLKWLERRFHFLEVLSTVNPLHLFLNVDTITAVSAVSAVGDSSTLPCLSPGEYLEICISSILPSMDDIGDEMETSCPLMNEGGLLEASILYSLLDEKQAKRLQETWSLVESFLQEYGISCSLNVAEHHMTFSTTRRTTEPYITDKAWCLLELLSTTHVPVSMAIDIIYGSVEHDYIKIGIQEGGLCSIHGIKEEEYRKRWNCLRWSLQALSELKGCDLFLNANTVTAVGTSCEVSRLIRLIVEDCIISNVCPATAARKVSDNLLETYRPTENTEDPHVAHMKMKYDGMAEITCFCRFYANATVLEEDWQMLQSCLKDYSISCTLVANDCGMTVSIARSIGDSDIVGKAWDLVRLMSATKVQARLAEKILKGTLHCVFIKTGYDGGLCSKIGIKMRQFSLLLPRLEYILKNAASRTSCKLLIKDETIIVVGKYPAVLNWFEMHARKWLEEQMDDYESRKD